MVLQRQGDPHADKTPVTVMQMGENEKSPKKVMSGPMPAHDYNPVQAVIYDFQDSRSGQHAEDFLKGWRRVI
ncbi:transposase [Acinetobacter baumannii]